MKKRIVLLFLGLTIGVSMAEASPSGPLDSILLLQPHMELSPWATAVGEVLQQMDSGRAFHWVDSMTQDPDEELQVLALLWRGQLLAHHKAAPLTLPVFQEGLRKAEDQNFDPLRMLLHYAIGQRYYLDGVTTDSSIHQLRLSLALCMELGDIYQEKATRYLLGNIQVMTGQYNEAEGHLKRVLHLYTEAQDSGSISATLYPLAVLESHRGNYSQALAYAYQNMSILEKIDEPYELYLCYNSIGHIFDLSGDYGRSLAAYRRSLAVATEQSAQAPRAVGMAFGKIGHMYRMLTHYDSALQALRLAHYDFQSSGNPVGWLQYELGATHLDLGQYDSAHYYLEPALAEARARGRQTRVGEIQLERGQLAIIRGNINQALEYLQEAYAIGQEPHKGGMVRDEALRLADAHKALGGYQAAEAYLREHLALSDSLNNDQIARRLTLQQATYAFNQRRDSIQSQHSNERRLLESELRTQGYQRAFFISGLLLAVLIIGVVIRRNRLKNRLVGKLKELNMDVRQQAAEIREQNEEIRAQRDHLEQVMQDKDRFFSIIAHDLRGPINSFGSLSFLLIDMMDKGNVKDARMMMDALDTNAKQVAQLLENLLMWSIQQQGGIKFKLETIDLLALVNNLASVVQLQAEQKFITLTLNIPPDTRVWADTNSLMTILRNLVSNALKFTRPHGEISVMAETEDQRVTIRVKDSGIGMTPDVLEKLFELDKSKVKKGTKGERGTGLGLVLVKDFVNANQGTLSVESTPGEGTTFIIELPAGETQG